MPGLGVRSFDYSTETATHFVPLIEKLSNNIVFGETLCSGSCEMFCQAMKTKTFQLHATASVQSNSTVLELSKGSKGYERLLKDIQTANNIAAEKGKHLLLMLSAGRREKKTTVKIQVMLTISCGLNSLIQI